MDSRNFTLADLANQIKEENKTFKKLSLDEKKVVIAQDCIARIKLEQFKPNCGTFIRNTNEIRDTKGTLKNLLNNPNLDIQCEACAKGGLFLSVVGRINNFKKEDLVGSNSRYNDEHSKLLEIFTVVELAYIEFAFEGQQYIGNSMNDTDEERITFTTEEKIKARQFYIEYGGEYDGEVDDDENFETYTEDNDEDDDSRRMIAICENIIKNKGHFIL